MSWFSRTPRMLAMSLRRAPRATELRSKRLNRKKYLFTFRIPSNAYDVKLRIDKFCRDYSFIIKVFWSYHSCRDDLIFPFTDHEWLGPANSEIAIGHSLNHLCRDLLNVG